MAKIDKLFRTTKQYGASDLYLSVGAKPAVRINDDLVIIEEHDAIDRKTAEEYILEIMTEAQKKKFEQDSDIDFAIEVPDVARFRVNIFVQRKGLGAAFRLIPEELRTIKELNLPSQLEKIVDYKSGLVIVTGPTGSGKSTTLAAIVDAINSKYQHHIVTIEDPIEYVHENKKCYIEQREVGSHTKSFKRALRAALREDTDVILVGEMRDLETISLALTAAETGHLVLTTLHTAGAAKSIDRIIDVFPAEQQNQVRLQLAETLRAVLWQVLLKTKDNKTRVPAMEVMFSNHAISNMIRKKNVHQVNSVIETRFASGMQTMKKSLDDLVQKDIVSSEVAVAYMPVELMEEG